MKILFLASRIPYPLFNGEDLRVYHLARGLCASNSLYLIAYGTKEIPPQVGEIFSQIHTLPQKSFARKSQSALVKMKNAFSSEQLFPFDPRLDSLIKGIVNGEAIDLIWVPAWEMIPYVNNIQQIPVCFDVMDDGVLEYVRELCHPKHLMKWFLDLKRLFVNYCFERKYFPHASFCCLVSEKDAEMLKWVCPKANPVFIPNGVDLEYFYPMEFPEDYPSLIFEGNMGFPPSVDGILYFCERIFPDILKEIPNVKLYIVGRNPDLQVQRLAGKNVTVTGFVQDVRPYLAKASIFICPMRKGAGIKNKILQAWAMGKPVIATSLSCGGLRINPGENIFVSDEPSEFASTIVDLLRDKGKRRRLGEKAAETVKEYYSWESQVRKLDEMMIQAVEDNKKQQKTNA